VRRALPGKAIASSFEVAHRYSKTRRARRHAVIGDRSAHYVEIKATNDTESRNEEACYEQAQGFEDQVRQAVPTSRSPRRNSIRSLVGGVGDLTALRILRR
jgi:hypothetical protein